MDSITSRVSRLSSTRRSHGSPVRGLALEALSTNMQHEGKPTTNEEEEQHPRTARTTMMDSVAQERAGHCSAPSSATFEYSYSYYPVEEDEGNVTVDDNSGDISKNGDATRQTVNDTTTGMPCHTARLLLSDTSGQLLGTPLSPALHEGTGQPEQMTARSTGSHNASLLATATPHITPRESALQMSGHTPITFTYGAGPTTPVMAVASHDNSSSGTSGSLWQLRQRVAASRARLERTDYYIARCIEAIGGRRDRIALLQHQLSQEEQRLSSYRDRTASMQAELRQGRDRRRVREELAMLADMYTEREIRLEALEQRRGALQELWAQLELLCGATTAPHPGDDDESAEHQDEAQHEEGEAKHEQEDKDKEGNEEEEVARESSQLSILSQSSASVLQNFLAGLLQEVETLAQICIQLPSPPVPMSHTARRSQARRAASPDLRGFCTSRDRDDDEDDVRNVNNTRASQAGFFSFFGGATEDHLSAKPLSTFLSCAGRLQHSAWELEETLQLRARELASDAEEEELRRRCTTLMDFRGSVRSTARLTAPITTTTTAMRGSTVCGNNEEEEESLGEPLRGTALMTPWADIEEGKGTATQDNNSDAAVAVEEGTRLSVSLMMPDLTLSARRLGSTGSGGSASARAQGGSNGAPVNSPRPHTPRSAMATNTSISLTARQRDNGVPRATRKTVTLAPLLYAYPRLSFVSHQLDLEQGKVQKSYEQDIERETEKRRVMVRRLKAAYKAQIEPPLRDALRRLYEQRRTIVQELAALGVTEVTLQWQEQEELPRELLMQAARVGCCTGMTDPYMKSVFSEAERTQCSGMLGDVLLPVMLEGSVRVRSVSRRQAAAQRARRGDQLHSDEEEEDEERVQMLLPAPLQSSPLSLNTPNVTATTAGVQAPIMLNNKSSSCLARRQRYLRQVLVHPQDFVTAVAPSRKSDDASHEQSSTTRLRRTSDTAATMEETELLAGRFSAGRLSDFCPRRSGTCETPPLSSRGTQSSASGLRSSYGTSTHSSEPRSSATLTGTTTATAIPSGAATERRGGLMEGVTNDINDESELHSTVPLARRAAPAEPPAATATTSATLRERDSANINTTVSNNSTSSRAVRMTEKAQASTTTTARRSSLSQQARKAIHALRNAVKDTRTPLPTHGSPSSNGNRNMMAMTPSAANDISNVSADSPEWFDAATVKVTLCFAGPEAQRRRAVAEAREQHQRSLWVLREELARVNEANFAAQAQLQELEAAYEAKRLQHASRVREAAAKLAETKNLLRSLVAEHAEWVSIRDDMQAMLDQQAHRHRQHRHHHHNSNSGSGGEHHHHHKRHSEEEEQQPRTARTPHAQ